MSDSIYDIRRNTPCEFKDGISYVEFHNIVHIEARKVRRIKSVIVREAVIICVVESQTEYSDWSFQLDFNNWGHLTNTFWIRSENDDSNIPRKFGMTISGIIDELMYDREIHRIDYSEYVDGDIFRKIFEKKEMFQRVIDYSKQLLSRTQKIAWMSSQELVGENAYFVISYLKKNGYKNIRLHPIMDVGENSDKYVYEVEDVLINGNAHFKSGEMLSEYAEIIIKYHLKKTILMPYSMKKFVGKNYIEVGDRLQELGFSNIYELPKKDLIFGLLIKHRSVQRVLIEVAGEDVEIVKNEIYEYDLPITIEYHSLRKKS